MENEENKKKVKIFAIIIIVIVVITIILYIVSKQKQDDNKFLSGYDYIVEKETDYSDRHGPLPLINLHGVEIDTLNKEIISKYYGVAPSDDKYFYYETTTYKDVLSLLLTVVHDDGSEYGDIEYYSYNINLKTNDVLTDKLLLEHLNIENNVLNDAIDKRLHDYYNKDSLKKTTKYEEYLKVIGYDAKNIKLYISDNSLYCYVSLDTTYSLTEYEGNFNKIKIAEL